MKIKDLKVGDKVITNGRRLAEVVRVTQKYVVITGNSAKFSRATGWRLGEGIYRSDCIEAATPERMVTFHAANRRNNLIKLGDARLRSIANLDRLAEIVNGITE